MAWVLLVVAMATWWIRHSCGLAIARKTVNRSNTCRRYLRKTPEAFELFHKDLEEMQSAQFSPAPRVLSIQSHTVHGYVGNKAATFPLQTIGYDVQCINSISLSNHPGYAGGFRGKSLEAQELDDFIAGLEGNDLLNYEAVVTGYTRSAPFLQQISKAVAKVKEKNNNALYICDPVLGDNGKFYVPTELVDIYQQIIFPLAAVITPNHFEAESLSGVKIGNIGDAYKACAILHRMGPEVCIITGVKLQNQKSATVSERFSVIASIKNTSSGMQMLRIDLPFINGSFSGCGDLFSALVTAGLCRIKTDMYRAPYLLGDVLEIASDCMTAVLTLTLNTGSKELRVIESAPVFRLVHQRLDDLMKKFHRSDGISPQDVPLTFNGLIENDASLTAKIPQYLHHSYSIYPTYVAGAQKVSGIIFDMDGTLTAPGAIDFAAIYRRLQLKRSDGDIIAQINKMENDEERKIALAIVVDEEMKGCERMMLRPQLIQLFKAIRTAKVRTALSTRNCLMAYEKFMELLISSHTDGRSAVALDAIDDESFNLYTELHSIDMEYGNSFTAKQSLFHPVLHRDSLNGINKPDPLVAQHILDDWEILPGHEKTVWFVGDSIDDMLCGKAAGCSTCLILTDYNKLIPTENPGLVNLAVDNLADLATYLDLPIRSLRAKI